MMMQISVSFGLTEGKLKMLLVFSLTLLLCVSTHCDNGPSDKEIDAAFRDIEEALKYRKDVQSMIKDVKKAVSFNANLKKNAIGMAKSLASALPKLMSDNGLTVAQGALTLAAGIAAFIPGGNIISSVATLIANVIGIINEEKTESIRDVMKDVLQEARDDDLTDKVVSFTAKINEWIAYLNDHANVEITERMLISIDGKERHATAVGLFPILRNRIHKHRSSSNPAEARRAFDFSVMYVQLITLQELALDQVVMLVHKNFPHDAFLYNNSKNRLAAPSRDALSFWNSPKVEHAGALVHYYPLGSSKEGTLLRDYLRHINVSEAKPVKARGYILMSIKWPTYHLFFSYAFYESSGRFYLFSFLKQKPTKDNKIIFLRRPDGYFMLRTMEGFAGKMGKSGGYAYVNSYENPDRIFSSDSKSLKGEINHFIVIRYPGTDIITISCRKWPSKFVSGQKNDHSVVLKDGNIGPDIRFYTDPCNVKGSGDGPHYCPDFTPKLE